MCLDSITETIKKPSMKVVELYKGFRTNWDGILEFPCQYYKNRRAEDAKRGVWLKAKKEKVYIGENFYMSGFHCNATKRGASWWGNTVLKIKAKGIRYVGRQRGKVFVADYIFIPKEKK